MSTHKASLSYIERHCLKNKTTKQANKNSSVSMTKFPVPFMVSSIHFCPINQSNLPLLKVKHFENLGDMSHAHDTTYLLLKAQKSNNYIFKCNPFHPSNQKLSHFTRC